ncbi:putative ribonuclease H-like domain-containing protein [Tanacetum coccineum]|uniref:Ribonuclease H-like domain-containing protein n=1 Tax=Tanacetum coccineum TaxID=301880 RepID=A0ABQ5A2J2_9ASTR
MRVYWVGVCDDVEVGGGGGISSCDDDGIMFSLGSQIPDKSIKGLGFVSYNVVPPPPTGLFSLLNLNLSYSGLEEFQQPEFEGYGPKPSKSVSEDTSNEVKESSDTPLVKELVSDDKLEKKTIFPTVFKMEFVRPKQQEKSVRKPVKYAEMYSFDHVQANCNYHQRERVVSGNNYTRVNYNYSAKKTHPSAHRNMVPRAVLMKTGLRSLNTARPVNTAHPKTTVYSARPMSHFSKSAQSTVKRPYQKNNINYKFLAKSYTAKGKFYTARPKAVNTARPNSAVVNAVRGKSGEPVLSLRTLRIYEGYVTFGGGAKGGKKLLVWNLKDASKDETSGILKNFITEIENLVDKKVKIIRCDNGTEFKNRVMSEFCEQKGIKREFSVARTPQQNGKFDGKSDEGFFVGYSLNSKAFRVYNIRTTKVEENLHIRFLEDKPIIAGDGPKWLFDIDVLTKSMNYVPVVAGTNSNDLVGTGRISIGQKDDEGVSKASGFSDQEQPESSTPNINTVGPSINTASANFKTGSLNINTVSPTVITTRSNRSQNVSDMFSLGRSATLEATHADLFGDEIEMDMSNLTTSYQVPTTPNTRIHKDHSLDHVIGDIQSGVQTRGMTKNTNEHGFISAVYEGKTHEDLHTCLFACFLSQEEPKRIAKALSDPAWVVLSLCFLYGLHGISDGREECFPLWYNLRGGEKYSEEDLPMKLVELVNQRKKFFAQQRAEAKRNKLMTLAQQKTYMSTYIKNQEGGYSIKQLKSLSFEQKILWVELKRLFEPDIDDILWKLQRYMHDPLTWRLYDTYGVHHVSIDRGHDIFMLVEKDYPLTRELMTMMLANKLQVDQSSEMANELLRKILIQA